MDDVFGKQSPTVSIPVDIGKFALPDPAQKRQSVYAG
jgi:hypothetical protein